MQGEHRQPSGRGGPVGRGGRSASRAMSSGGRCAVESSERTRDSRVTTLRRAATSSERHVTTPSARLRMDARLWTTACGGVVRNEGSIRVPCVIQKKAPCPREQCSRGDVLEEQCIRRTRDVQCTRSVSTLDSAHSIECDRICPCARTSAARSTRAHAIRGAERELRRAGSNGLTLVRSKGALLCGGWTV